MGDPEVGNDGQVIGRLPCEVRVTGKAGFKHEFAAVEDAVEGAYWIACGKRLRLAEGGCESPRVQNSPSQLSPDVVEVAADNDRCLVPEMVHRMMPKEATKLDSALDGGETEVRIGDNEASLVSVTVKMGPKDHGTTSLLEWNCEIDVVQFIVRKARENCISVGSGPEFHV